MRPTTRLLLALAVAAAATTATVSARASTATATATATGMAAPAAPVALTGEGGTFASPILDQLELDAPSSIDVSYNELPGLDTARTDFASGTNDFAVVELPLTSAEATTAHANGHSFAYVPFAAQPVALGFELLQQVLTSTTAVSYNGLHLSAPTLAAIFTGAINTWLDPRVTADNGGHAVSVCFNGCPAPNLLAEDTAEPSAANAEVLQLLLNNPAARTIWDTFATANKLQSDTDYENNAFRAFEVQGADRHLVETLHPLNADTGLPDTNQLVVGDGDIAPIPMDWTVAPWNIPTIAVQNQAGSFVTPTPASMSAALKDATVDPATNLVSFTGAASDAAAYALPAISYLVVPTSGLTADKASALASFIRFVVGPAGQQDVLNLGGVEITAAMQAAGLEVADQVAAEGAPTTTTAPPATTSPRGATSGTGAVPGAPTTTPAGAMAAPTANPATSVAGSRSQPSAGGAPLDYALPPIPPSAKKLLPGPPLQLASRMAAPVPMVLLGLALVLLGVGFRYRARARRR